MKRSLLFALSMLLIGAPTSTQAEEPQESPKIKVGADVPQMRDTAGRAVKGLCYGIAAVILAVSFVKKYRGGASAPGSAESISIVAKKAIGPRSALVLTDIEGRRFLLAQSGDQITLLSEIMPEVASEALAPAKPSLVGNSSLC